MKPMSRPFAYLLLIGLFLPGFVALYGQQRTPEEDELSGRGAMKETAFRCPYIRVWRRGRKMVGWAS